MSSGDQTWVLVPVVGKAGTLPTEAYPETLTGQAWVRAHAHTFLLVLFCFKANPDYWARIPGPPASIKCEDGRQELPCLAPHPLFKNSSFPQAN